MKFKMVLPLAVIGLVTLACTLPSLGDGSSDPNVLFTDDFSDDGSGWDIYEDSDGSVGYLDGAYRITVATSDFLFWGNPYQDLQNDVKVAVDATKAGGPDDNEYGLICRYVDEGNFYMFAISSDGYAAITMYQNDEFAILSGETGIQSDAIRQGAATNHIEATCIGSSLALYINDTLVVSATDSSHTGGDVGLYAGSFDTGGVDIRFDNFVVSKP